MHYVLLNKEICLFTILKLSLHSWIPAFAGMTNKDGTYGKNMSFPPRIKYGINSSGNPVLLIIPSGHSTGNFRINRLIYSMCCA